MGEKFSLVTPEDSVVVSITHAMKEVETITSEEDETFLDEEGSGEDKKDEPVSDKGEGENKSDETDQKSE